MGALKKLFGWSFPAADKPKGDFDKKEAGFYLTGMFGQNIIYNIIGAALSLYYSDVVGISISTVGIVFTICRVWDAINDPIMGVIMEKTRSKYGKCRPWLKYIPFPIALVTTLLFIPMSNWAYAGKVAFLFIMYFMWSPMYTMGDIPLWSLPSRMIPDEGKRTKLISAARIVGSFGAVITAIYAPIKNFVGGLELGIFPNTGMANHEGYFSQEQGYFFTTLVLCIIGAFLFKFVFVGVRERVTEYDSKPVTFKNSFSLIKKNTPFIRVLISGILGCTKTLLLTAGMYFCKWVMGNGDEGLWVIILGAPYLVGTLIAFATTPVLGKKFSKKRLYLWTSYLSAIPMIILFFVGFTQLDNLAGPAMLSVMLILMLVFGFLSNFSVSLQPIMIADSVDYLEWKAGERGDGVFAAGLTFIAKLTSGIAILISNIMLGAVNYTPVIDGLNEQIKAASAVNEVFALDFSAAFPRITLMMFALITLVPAAGCILQAIPMHRYEISDGKLTEIRAENEKRRAAIKAEEEANASGETDESAESDEVTADVEVSDVAETTAPDADAADEVKADDETAANDKTEDDK